MKTRAGLRDRATERLLAPQLIRIISGLVNGVCKVPKHHLPFTYLCHSCMGVGKPSTLRGLQ